MICDLEFVDLTQQITSSWLVASSYGAFIDPTVVLLIFMLQFIFLNVCGLIEW